MPACEDPLMARIYLKSRDGLTTYHVYDAFAPSNDIHVTSLDLKYSLYQAPEAAITIEDSGNTLNQNVINGCKIQIDLGKSSASMTQRFSGYARSKTVRRSDTGAFDMTIHAYGSGIRFNERIANFFRIARRTSFGTSSEPDMADSSMQAYRIMQDLVTDTDHMPLGEPAEQFTTSGIDSSLAEVVPSLALPFAEWSDIANQINDSIGSTWGVDENDDVFMRYPTLSSSKVTIKDAKSISDSVGTCYFVGGWDLQDSIKKPDGFANRLYGRGGNEMAVDAYSATDAASTGLHDRSLAIQFTPGDSWNAQALSVLLHKEGTVPSSIQAVLRVDRGNTPGASIAATTIKTANIGISVTQVTFGFPTNSVHIRNMQFDKPHWLQLSKCGSDASNAVYWHRDTGTSGRNAYKIGSGPWTVQTGLNGYTFCYAQLTSRAVLSEASDPDSIETYGVIEAVIDAPWIIEGRTMDKYLSSILQWTAKPKRICKIPVCTIPDILPMPGQTAELVDTKTGFSTGNNTEILETSYHMDAMGTRRMSLSLVHYPDNERLTART